MARYLAVIDRPTPLDVAEVDGTVIVVTGVGALHAPTAADVHDATPEAWTALPQTAPAAPVSQAPGDVVLCDELPLAPAFLADGSPAGEGVDELGDNGHRRVHWGDGDAQVSQVLPSPNDAGVVGGEWFTLNEPENVFLDGRFVAAVHLVGDEGVGNSVVEIVDTAAGCGYLFDVGPDARLDVVRRLADALRTALTREPATCRGRHRPTIWSGPAGS